jgi:hypothetical protein
MRFVLLALGLVALALVLHVMGVQAVLAMARQSGWTLAWMVILYAAHVGVRGWVIWRNLPPPGLGLGETLRVRFAAEAIEMLTFTGPFLAEPAKGWMFVRRGIPAAQAAGVIAFEYLSYMLVASWIAIAGLLVLLRRGAFPPAVRGAVVALVVGLALFAIGVIVAAITGVGLLAPIVRRSGAVIGDRRAAAAADAVAAMESHLLGILSGDRRRLFEALAAQCTGHTMFVLEIVLLFRALGYGTRLGDAWVVEGGVKFINAAFVFVPGQFGAAEGANALVLGALGYPAALGVTLALMRRLRAYIVAAPGLALVPRR